LNENTFFVDDPNRDKKIFDKAVASKKPVIVVCDPLLILGTNERVMKFLESKFGSDIEVEWIYFENDQKAAWANHLKRNETDPRAISEKFHKELAKKYTIPEGATIIPVYKPNKR
jgi:hypothetical protein